MAEAQSKPLETTSQTKSSEFDTDAKPTEPTPTPISNMTECAQVEDTEAAGKDTEDEDEEEEDIEDEDEDGYTPPSDLQEALEEALDESNFEFHGSFYHGSLLTSTPNPCLIISGLGLVGLPLSERDAKAIISCSAMAPFGQGERLVVDKEVRDTWELEASSVSFGNATWLDYVNKTLCAQICKSLGIEVGLGTRLPRMELYKLLLYETGSHFLPHQDTQKADGMFATAIILLPSAYTGGEVIVSHASSSRTIDFAKDSAFSMASLAWYTDVKHEVKPVTSGYRLALSYNLIHVAPPGVPPPRYLDTTDNINELRQVLTKWRDNQYKSSSNFMAYMLDHKYSPANLSRGLNALKGSDLHRVSFLRPIAEELGFRVGLAHLEHNVRGEADTGYGDSYNYQSRRGRDVPDMDKSEIYRDTTISELVNLNGRAMLSIEKLSVESDCLIPNNPFKDVNPDDKEYEGYQGNHPGTVEHWYRRSAFFLMHETRIEDVFFANEGIPYAFRMLQRSTAIPPTAEDRRWAARMFEDKYRSLSQEQVLSLLNFSLKWRDLELWKATTNQSACTLKMVNAKVLFDAIEIFSFDAARLSFETMLARSTDLVERLKFLSRFASKVPESVKNTVNAWYQCELSKILSAYKPNSTYDVPTILSIIRVCKLETFVKIVMPNIIKEQQNYHFCMALTKELSQNRQNIIEQESSPTDQKGAASSTNGDSSPSGSTADAVDTLIKQCLQTAMSQWNDVPQRNDVGNYYNYRYPSYTTSAPVSFPKVDRIIEIIDQAMSLSDLETCRALFIDMLKRPGTSAELIKRYKDIYTPLIPRLRTLLATKNLQLSQPPFGDFIQLVIGAYLRDILGPKDQVSNIRLRKIGCGCGECKTLDDFILGSRSSILIQVTQSRRVHLEQQVAAAHDLCTYKNVWTGRRPFTGSLQLQLTKLPAVVEAQSRWSSRKESAKKLLASVGSESEIACIMGTRYADVKSAIDGTQPFVSVPTTLPALSMSGGLAFAAIAGPSTNVQPALASSSSSKSTTVPVLPPSTNAVPGQLAGKKRKI